MGVLKFFAKVEMKKGARSVRGHELILNWFRARAAEPFAQPPVTLEFF